MAAAGLSIRIDLTSSLRIGPGKIALLEVIRSTGSISAAARSLGMSYRRAWLLVEAVNGGQRQPAVKAGSGGRHGGGATLTVVGERIVDLYHDIESQAVLGASRQFGALGIMAKREKPRAIVGDNKGKNPGPSMLTPVALPK
jgi:molybdate transport system regulatory protein